MKAQAAAALTWNPGQSRLARERVMPDAADGQFVIHQVRYHWAAGFAVGCDVLDAGCGAGYGAAMLARVARSVLAVDADREVVAWARERYGSDRTRFAVADVRDLGMGARSVDLVVGLQILEHIRPSTAFLDEAWRILRPGGRLIVSTENAQVHHLHLDSLGIPDADSHVNVMSRDRFRREVRARFPRATFLCQRPRGHWLHTLLKALDPLNLRLRLLHPARREAILTALRMPVRPVPAIGDYCISAWLTRQAPIQIALCEKEP